ncbi:MAG: TonB-dependent receptor [Bacteroidales bacterium]|nr:TonB-dependent receptor [Bacteroidales bacterium]
MKKLHTLFIFCLFTTLLAAGQTIKINGRVYDKNEGTIISGGAIFLDPDNKATTTDQYGEYSFVTSPGAKQIITRVLGYKASTIKFDLKNDTVINIYIQVSPIELSEVTIIGDSLKNVEITSHGSFIITPAAIYETPKHFSEPDLLKAIQLLPGVIAGKDGTSDIYVRGGGLGQNIILANGCYFFLPGHLLGIVSPYDLDFLESAELYKDYFPSELGGGASSVISLNFKKPHSDSLRAQLRLGLLSSGLIVEAPLKKINWDLTAGLKRGNYSIYAPILKKIVARDVGDFLPPNKYSFYDSFIRLSHSSPKYGDITYLFFGNYDKGKDENKIKSQSGDTLIKYVDGISTGWNNMVHAFQWDPPVGKSLKWKLNLNYNRISMGRKIYTESEKFLNGSDKIGSTETLLSFYPTVNNIGTLISVGMNIYKFSFNTGISNRLRYFSQNNYSLNSIDDTRIRNDFGENDLVNETSLFMSSTTLLAKRIKLEAGVRLSEIITRDANFFVTEPRLRFSYNNGGIVSPHINYVRLSQSDHAVEGSNAGLRTMLWLPVYKEFGPEISDVFSAGFHGNIDNNITWTLDGYYKRISGMVDFKPGASFIFDTSFVDMLDRVNGKAYGLETGIIRKRGKLTGSVSYTYSRSKREWGSPEGMIWIPSGADRPHTFNLSLKYYFKAQTSFGLNWVYLSGAPATIYMNETSYGEFFETKNNIRYFDYHRLDLSFRQIFHKRKSTFFIDADIYNVYNRKNTYYFRETFDETDGSYYFKNISLFPVMPSLSLRILF